MPRRYAIWAGVCLLAAVPAPAQEVGAPGVAAQPWWLSAGVFRTDGAAEARLHVLTVRGIADARVVEAGVAGAGLHRVVVGPFADRGAADVGLTSLRRLVPDAFPVRLAAAPTAPHTRQSVPATAVEAEALRTPPEALQADAATGVTATGGAGLSARVDLASTPPTPASARSADRDSKVAGDVAEPPRPAAKGRASNAGAALAGSSEAANGRSDGIAGSPSTAAAIDPGTVRRGITLRDYLRRNGGNTPTAPAEAPAGYQVHRLFRSTDGGSFRSPADHDVTPGAGATRAHPAPRASGPIARAAHSVMGWLRWLFGTWL